MISDATTPELDEGSQADDLARAAKTVLTSYQDQIVQGLRSALGILPKEVQEFSQYHLGLQPGARPGKALRPTLTLLLADGLGALPKHSRPLGTAVQLIHDFSLLHDDIVDEDRSRRGQPALWVRSGMAAALNTGDALLTAAFCVISSASLPAAIAARGARWLGQATLEMVGGQQADIAATGTIPSGLADYLDVIERKTGALMGAATALGAVAADAPEDTVAASEAFGRTLGVAFQLRDDMLGVFGDSQETGKPVGNDLLRGKLGLPLLLAITGNGGLGSIARGWLQPPGLQPDQVGEAVAALQEGGVASRCQALTTTWTEKALAAAAQLPLLPGVSADLEVLCRWLGERWN